MDFMNLKGVDKSDYNNLMIVDSLNFGFRFKHMGKREFAAEYLRTIQSFATSYEAKRVIITGDGGSTWRKSIYPEYKANRKTLKENQTEEEKAEWESFFNEMDNTLDLLRNTYTVLKYGGVEADDLIAYVAKTQAKDYNHTWIISTDKDLDLLISNKVSRFSYINRKEVTIDTFESQYTYPPEWHLGIKMLMGDKGDNIPGVDGVGIKRAYTLLNSFDGDIFDLMDNMPIPGKYKYIQNLNEFGTENLYLNMELMDLETYCEDCIGPEILGEIDEQL